MQQKWPAIRDIILFLVGLAGAAHETLWESAERPTLLILFAAMMGLPAFLRADAGKLPSSSPSPQPQEEKQLPPHHDAHTGGHEHEGR